MNLCRGGIGETEQAMEDKLRQNVRLKVLVAHPGTQHSYQTALALQKAGMLQRYATGFYYRPSSLASMLLKLLPQWLAARLERQLLRRRHAELDPGLICTSPWLELSYIISARLKFTKLSGRVLRWRNRRFDKKTARMVEAMRPDAVICYDSCALETFRACKKTGSLAILDQSSPPLYSTLEILRDEARLRPTEPGAASLDMPAWLIEQCRQETKAADRILAASEFVRDCLVGGGVPPARIARLPYGVDTARFYPKKRQGDGKFRVLYVGRISRGKGVQYLLEAFLRLGLPDAELVLVGSTAIEEEALAPYRGIFRHVPQVPHGEIAAYFQSADIFVFPSLFEGMALVVLEAMASGLPVITTPNAGSVVRDGIDGAIVPIRDAAALKEKMRLLYQDHALRESMGRQARLRAQDYTWDAYHRRLSALLREFFEGEAS